MENSSMAMEDKPIKFEVPKSEETLKTECVTLPTNDTVVASITMSKEEVKTTPTPTEPEEECKSEIIAEGTLSNPPVQVDTVQKGEVCVKAEFMVITRPVVSLDTDASKSIVFTDKSKKRPRDSRPDPKSQLCGGLATGKGCTYGAEVCKFGHDMAAFLEARPADFGPRCHLFDTFGHCKYGLNCRFGLSHFEIETLTFPAKPEGFKETETLNVLDRDIRTLLQKRKYPALAKEPKNKGHQSRKDKKNKKELENKETTTDADVAMETVEVVRQALDLPERKRIDFKGKVFIAPLTTVGNLPFRRIMKKYQADITCGEMALSQNLLQGQASEWALLQRHPCEDIFGVQIATAHGDMAARAAEIISRETTVDFIDINMGCPIDMLCKRGAGSALMNRPNKLEAVVRGALTGIALGSHGRSRMPELTVKMRTGWDHRKTTAQGFVPMIQGLHEDVSYLSIRAQEQYKLQEQLSVAAVSIHGRSRLMRYTKTADWDYIGGAADARLSTDMALIGNGDVFTFSEFHNHLEDGKLETCMIGRGALIKPWISTEIKERRHWDISASERFDMLKEFCNFGFEQWGSDQRGINSTRRFLLEWLSFLCRYVPVGIIERMPQRMNDRPPSFVGRNELETLMGSNLASDWVLLSERLLGPVPDDFRFQPKHKANAYA